MDSNSMDEDVNSQLVKKSSDDYMETCEEEVNDVLPRFQRFTINEDDGIKDETIDLPCDRRDIPCRSQNTITSSINTSEGHLIADSNEKVTPLFVHDESGTYENEANNAVVDNRKPLHETVRTVQNFSTDNFDDIRPQDTLQKAFYDGEINKYPVDPMKRLTLDETKGPEFKPKEPGGNTLDLSVKPNTEHHHETNHSSPISENKAEFKSLTVAPLEMERKDAETGELEPEHVDETDNDIVFIADSSNLSYFADESSDDQSSRSSQIIIDSPPSSHGAVNETPVANKRSRKIAVFVPPIAGMDEKRQRRFGIFQPQSTNPEETSAAKTNSSSDEDSRKPRFIRKVSPMNSKRRCRKTVKASPMSRTLNPSDLKNDEEKKPSPCKRKKVSSENLDETAEKFRKRSISEHNAETGEKTRLGIRSRSLSSNSKKGQRVLGNRQLSEISLTPQSRKRTISKSLNTDCIKYRESSISSD